MFLFICLFVDLFVRGFVFCGFVCFTSTPLSELDLLICLFVLKVLTYIYRCLLLG